MMERPKSSLANLNLSSQLVPLSEVRFNPELTWNESESLNGTKSRKASQPKVTIFDC